MTLSIPGTTALRVAWLPAAAVLARAAITLAPAALRHPGKPLAISRTTGRVAPR